VPSENNNEEDWKPTMQASF